MQAQRGAEVSTGNLPSKDPADDGTLGGALRSVMRKMMQGVDSMLPAKVLAYDRANNVATVQPLIAVLTTSGERVTRAQVARVPVLALGGGGFVINFPLKAGDLGWIEASDRDISLYMQSFGESQPNTLRMHSFEDGRFIPDMMKAFDLGDVADDAMTIQSADGAVRIEISPAKLKLVAPEIEVVGPATFRDLATFEDDTITNGIRFSTHKHTGVQTGGGTSGGPTS